MTVMRAYANPTNPTNPGARARPSAWAPDFVTVSADLSDSPARRGDALPPSADLETIRKATLGADLRATFIVDEQGAVIGFINGNQLARRMLNGDIHAASTAAELMGTAGLPFVYPGDTLAGAMLASARPATRSASVRASSSSTWSSVGAGPAVPSRRSSCAARPA